MFPHSFMRCGFADRRDRSARRLTSMCWSRQHRKRDSATQPTSMSPVDDNLRLCASEHKKQRMAKVNFLTENKGQI